MNGNTPFFSILVPVFNRAGKLQQSMECLKNQSFEDIEIVIVDDGSTDDSYSELEDIFKGDTRVTILRHEKNSSLLAARYTAMRHAKGRYILFMDSDDAIRTDTCQILHGVLQDKDTDLVMFGFSFEPSGRVMMPKGITDPLEDMFSGKILSAIWKCGYSAEVIRKTVENSEGFYCNMGEDSYLSTILLTYVKDFVTVEERLYFYNNEIGMSNERTHLNKARIEKAIESMLAAKHHQTEFLASHNPEKLESTKHLHQTMFRFMIRQHVYLEEDMANAVAALKLFDIPELSEYFEYGCNVLLPHKIKKKLGLVDNDINILE